LRGDFTQLGFLPEEVSRFFFPPVNFIPSAPFLALLYGTSSLLASSEKNRLDPEIVFS